jgi:DNA-directed RNA polymerase subunit M/transcription elongation factor TFIIS
MVSFCTACDKLLTSSFTNEELTFKCELCLLSYPSTPEDSLRRERIKENNIMIYEKILNKAVDDPASFKARITCLNKKCDNDIVVQVRIGEDMRLYNICIKCRFQWLNN